MPLAMSLGRNGWPISLRKSRISNARSNPRARRLMVSSVMSSVPIQLAGSLTRVLHRLIDCYRGQALLPQENAFPCGNKACPRCGLSDSGLFLVGDAVNLDLALALHVSLHQSTGRSNFGDDGFYKYFVENQDIPRVFHPHTEAP